MLRLPLLGTGGIESIVVVGKIMRNKFRDILLVSVTFFLLPGVTLAQREHRGRILVIVGRAGQTTVLDFDGRSFVDLEALAQIMNGSLSFKANRIILSLPATMVSPAAEPPSSPVDDHGLSRDFMKAGIEAIALMREWASPLAYAIQNGYNVTEDWVAGYREPAAHGLRIASSAATTDADRSALQLLTNEFEAVREWSNKLIEARKSMDTAKYALSDTALRNDPLSQKIITCGHFLASMLGSASFKDDPSCH